MKVWDYLGLSSLYNAISLETPEIVSVNPYDFAQ